MVRTFATITIVFFLVVSLTAVAVAQEKKTDTKNRRPRIGLVLSGGGAKGLAHVGVLKVLEEAGIVPDYIAGTSMGSIVGGLYASGYSAALLEKLVVSLDWDDILSDAVPRRSVSIDEKDDHERYIGSFSIKNGKIQLPKGYKRGQKLTSVLSRLTLHVQHIKNFKQLPIPFICIGTNIVTGDAEVLDSGYLPDAMRASMSIPSIFTPVEIGDKLLVDGGVVRNLPVQDARDMGADIIIAVDVGAPLYKKQELDSVAEIMDQSVSFLGVSSTREQRKLANVLIIPDISGFKASEFKRGNELIAVGEKAAREALPRLREIAERQKGFPRTEAKTETVIDQEKIYIKSIRVEGLERVSRSLVMGKLLINAPVITNANRIMAAIERVYASQFFERVTYRLEPAWDFGAVLVINVVESTTVFLKLGFSYDTDMNAAILLNMTLRNLMGQGSKFNFDLRLSDNPGARLGYFLHTAWRKPGIGFGFNVAFDQYKINSYQDNSQIAASFTYRNFGGNFMIQAIIFNSMTLGAGIQKDYTDISNYVAPNDARNRDKDTDALSYYGYVSFDNLDRTFYPRSGFQIYGEARYFTDQLSLRNTQLFDPFMKYTVKMRGYIPFHRRVVMFVTLNGGTIQCHEPYRLGWNYTDGVALYRQKMPAIYLNYLGGLNSYNREYFPFLGLKFLQASGRNLLSGGVGFQIEYMKDMYVIVRGNVARTKQNVRDLFRLRHRKRDNPEYGYDHIRNDLIYGYGLTLGFDTLIGPVELTGMSGSENKFLAFVSIGYRI